MINKLYTLMNENPVDLVKLHAMIAKMNTVDIADAFDLLDSEKLIRVFRLLPKSIAAEVFSYITHERQQIIVEALTDAEAGRIIDQLFVDDAVDFIEEMPANVVKRVLRNISEDKRKTINQILQYPDDSAGSIMTTEYVDLKEHTTVKEAFDIIRATGVNKETIYTCYVIQRDKVLIGMVTAKDLLLAKPEDKISEIMDTNLIFAHTTDDQEAIAALFSRYSLLSLPVVDKEQRLVGIVTFDDIVEIIHEENTEDMERMAAINPSEEPYMKTGIFTHTRNRILWLTFLMLSATISVNIIDSYQESLAVVPLLLAYIPVLMGTGGNAGAQTCTMIVRGIALNEINYKNLLIVLWYEIRIALFCGAILAIVNFIRVFILNSKDYMICLTISLALVATVVIAKSVGCMLPLIAKRIGLDPAIMAAPLITTIVDASSLIVYFTIARLILGI